MSVLASASSVAGAMPWISTADLPGLRAATAEERAGIVQVLAGISILDDFMHTDFLVHEGDLHVSGHFAPSGRLLVRGDLRVDGVYDDDRDLPYGIVAVLGDMQAQHIYSFASLHVKGDLQVEGVIASVYNDFTFKVGGTLNAAGLIVSDKDASYQPGELGFQLDDRYRGAEEMKTAHRLRHENGLRRLRPEFLGSAGFRDPVDEYETAYWVRVDEDGLRRAMHEGRPLLREAEAPAQLPQWLEAAFDFEADDASLLALVGKDPLVDQLMAAREELSAVVAEALARSGDPVVLEWLAITHPTIAQAHAGQSLQPGVAQRLAADPSTDHATLGRIARSPDAEVRAALAKRQDPPEALIRLLAWDPEPAVRDAILVEGFNVLALEPEALAPLIASADRHLANALAHASLSLEEVDALLPRMDRMGHIHLAQSLWRQSLGAQPARISAEQRVQLIDRLLAMSQMDGSARASAFLALDGAQQAERVAVLQQGDVDERRLMRLAAPEFVDWLLALAAEAGRAPTELGLNRGLSPDRQRRVFEVSLKAPEKERLRALEDLANNDCLEPDIAEALIRYSLQLDMRKRFELTSALRRRIECEQQPAVAEQIGRVPEPIETWRESWHLPVLSSEAWGAILARHQGLGARLKLKEWAAIGELEARRRAQP